MKSFTWLIILFLVVMLYGCGNAEEPLHKVKDSTQKGVQLPEDMVPSQVEPIENEVVVEQNSTITHIRVMEFDEASAIPEHLIKLPINPEKK
ncbi:MAG: hypothetical protein K0U47_04580 [Epsilonproteobacteria bacterium]|nr:hypothetical protein [Campylobacterota bacterium]